MIQKDFPNVLIDLRCDAIPDSLQPNRLERLEQPAEMFLEEVLERGHRVQGHRMRRLDKD